MLTEKDLATNRQWLWHKKERRWYRFRELSKGGLYHTFDPVKKEAVYLRQDEVDLYILHSEDVQAYIDRKKLPDKVHCLLEGYMIDTTQCFNQKNPDKCADCNQPTRDLFMGPPSSVLTVHVQPDPEPKKIHVTALKTVGAKKKVDTSIVAIREKILRMQKKNENTDEEEETERVGKRRYVSDFDLEPGERIGGRGSGTVVDSLFDEVLVERTHSEMLPERVKEEEGSDDTISPASDENVSDAPSTETKPSVSEPNLPEPEKPEKKEPEKETSAPTPEPELEMVPQISVQTVFESQPKPLKDEETSETPTPAQEPKNAKCKNFGKRDKCTGGIYCKGFCKSCYKAFEKERAKQKPKKICSGCKKEKVMENEKLQLCHSCINLRAKYRRKGYTDFCTECLRRPATNNGFCSICKPNFTSSAKVERKRKSTKKEGTCVGCKREKKLENPELELCKSCNNLHAYHQKRGYKQFCTTCRKRPAVKDGVCATCNPDISANESTVQHVQKKKTTTEIYRGEIKVNMDGLIRIIEGIFEKQDREIQEATARAETAEKRLVEKEKLLEIMEKELQQLRQKGEDNELLKVKLKTLKDEIKTLGCAIDDLLE